MRFTYDFAVEKIHALNGSICKCEAAINKMQTEYDRKKQELEGRWNSDTRKLRTQADNDKEAMKRKAEGMLEDALRISGEISQIEQTLIVKDKYYKKTKDKKEEELKEKRNQKYDSCNDYFEILDTIRADFERISRKYREHILPGIINGLHFLFSSKRKEDYEELIVLQNTIKVFIGEIKGNVNEIRNDAINQIEQEYRENYEELQKEYQNNQHTLETKYDKDISDVAEFIENELDAVFNDELMAQIEHFISEYKVSLNKVFDKNLGTSSFLSLCYLTESLEKIGTSGSFSPVYEFVVEKLGKIILNIGEDFLQIPILSYTDKSSNWYFRWDNNNRDFVHQLICDLMYSTITKVPVGHLCFDVIDPISRGTSIRAYYDARSKIPELFSDRIFFNSSDIDNRLSALSDYIDYISQRILGTKYNSVFEYADEKEDYIPDIKYLVIFDFPKGMTEVSLELLNNIVNQGPKCGVFAMIAETYDEIDVTRSSLYQKNLSEIKNRCQYVDVKGHDCSIKGKSIEIAAKMPDRYVFGNYIDRYLLIRESIKNKGLVFPKMLKPLLLSDDSAVISDQINKVIEFGNSMNEYNCFNVENIALPKAIGLGNVQYPVNLFESSCAYELITQKFAKYSNFAVMPFSIDLDDDLNIMILSDEIQIEKAVNFSHNILWSFFASIPASAFKTCIIDIEGHGKNAIPFIDFCSRRPDVFYGGVVSTHDQAKECLKELVKRIDEISFKRLGSKYQNLCEYNESACYGIEPITLLVVYDFAKELNSAELAELQKVVYNGNRCGIYTLLCGTDIPDGERRDSVKMAAIDSVKKACTILEPVEDLFRLMPFNVMLQPREQLLNFSSGDFVERYIHSLDIADEKERNKAPENDYTVLFDLTKPPVYKRGNKKIHLPYGISADGELYYCDFEKDNFAAFLCGSSGSGKSTLIHALITGILMNNHPDDVELWLADFKMKEFRRYVKNRPPHIKYILLEESPDAVYDFLERMQAKLSERERMSNAYTDLAKVPITQYMPLIFVIIDEFSIMSQIINQDETYKLMLQNLLAKGRALGFRFLFSSQTFTTGVTGLTATAKKQIQMRLAMKNPQEEIAETIDMSRTLMSEEQRRWLLTLPKYYILLKKLVGEGSTVSEGKVQDEIILTRAKGLYFPDEEYTAQNKYIQMITDTYKVNDKYLPTDIYSYKNKNSVAVDGSVYYSFMEATADIEKRLEYIKQHDSYAAESVRLFVGCPRSMQRTAEIVVDNEFEENVILFGTDAELCTSVILSAMASLGYADSTVSVIGYSKNRVYRRVNETGKKYMVENYAREEEICNLIHEIKTAIDNGTADNLFLFIMGLDVILKNIQFMSKAFDRHKKNKGSSISLNVDESKVFGNDDENISLMDKILREKTELGIQDSGDDIETEDSKAEEVLERRSALTSNNEVKSDIYDIREDLEVILNEGPRLGYHVFTYFRSYDEFKQTKYSLDCFKHKITFQCSTDDSRSIISKSTASTLGKMAFLYTDMQKTFTMRPYLHQGLYWDDWEVDKMGHAVRNQTEGGD